MSASPVTRRSALAALGAMAASGCSLSPTLELLGSSFDNAGLPGAPWGSKPYPVTADEIDALPYATMGLRFGRGEPAVLVLAEYEGEQLRWMSADRVVFATRGGFLVRTAGLPRDLTSTQWLAPDPLAAVARGEDDGRARVLRLIDLSAREEYGVPVESRFEVIGPETLEVLGRRRETVQVRERARVARWRWEADNRYWVDRADGRVWRSSQRFCPDLPPVELELLKPPG